MTDTVPMLVVFAIAVAELWAAVPAGLALGVPAASVVVAVIAGAMTGAGLVIALGAPFRVWVLSRLHRGAIGTGGRLERIWVRYGVVGLGLVAPLLVGALIGTAIGVTLGAPAGRLFAWTSVGIVLSTVLLTIAILLGVGVVTPS